MSYDYPDLPRVGVGAVVFKEEKVLLVLRGRSPARDQWAIPGGRLELGETLQAAAEREILEETGVVIRAGEPLFAFDAIEQDEEGRIRYHYVIVDLEAEYISGEPVPDDDALDARWISAAELRTLPVNPVTIELLKKKFSFG